MQDNNENAQKGSANTGNTDDWTTGSEPISDKQKSYLKNVQDEPVKDSISNATAFNMIDAATQHSDSSTATTKSDEVKEPSDWVTGSEEMTDAQRSYLKSLADKAGETVDETQSKATASQQIESLQNKNAGGEDETKK